MNQLRRKFGKRNENKRSFMQARMRDLEVALIHPLIPVKEDVEVDFSRGAENPPLPPERSLNALKRLFEFLGREFGLEFPDRIQILSMTWVDADGIGFNHARTS